MPMKKPDKQYPSAPATSPLSVPSPMPGFIHDPSIRGLSFDQLLSQRGVRMIHHKAIPCMNVLSTDFQAHDPNCQYCDGSGLIYYEAKEIWGVFSSNSLEKVFETHGVWEMGAAVITFPAEYPDGTQADFNTYDRIELPDFTVRLWELKAYEPRPDNKQSLRYPIERTEFVSSIVDGVQKFYYPGTDFNIDANGDIVWIHGREPRYNHALQRGEVIGYAYFAKPVYVVVQSLRELRITQEMIDGVKTARRLPQQVLVRRDFLVNPGEKLPVPVDTGSG